MISELCIFSQLCLIPVCIRWAWMITWDINDNLTKAKCKHELFNSYYFFFSKGATHFLFSCKLHKGSFINCVIKLKTRNGENQIINFKIIKNFPLTKNKP